MDKIYVALKEIVSRLNTIISNQKYIKADTTEIGQMLRTFYKNSNSKINCTVPFVIKNMTEAQAKDLMRQGMYPEYVALLSDNKFTVVHLYKLANGGK